MYKKSTNVSSRVVFVCVWLSALVTMILFPICSLVVLALQARAAPTPLESSASTIALAKAHFETLAKTALHVSNENITKKSPHLSGNCTLENLHIRRDWSAFSSDEKKAYIKSVLCLQEKPALTPSTLAPGVKSRYDDFVASHINQTLTVHFTKGNFLAWHRYFIFEFGEALRNECGYTGDYPYWNWAADTADMEKSEVFDGSDTSMSGNGAYIADRPDIKFSVGDLQVTLPIGTGGGCVETGPFKNYTVNLGPVALAPGGNDHPLDYNPRCLKRDLTTALLQNYANYSSIVHLLQNNDNIWDFENHLQGAPYTGSIGVHGAGHYSIGGDPGRDVYVSPGDPAFWLNHGMIDRVWWIWQNLDWNNRQNAISGTNTFLNQPPSANTTLDDVIDLGYANGGGSIAIRDIMSTTAGPYCYVYV
ncbi:hypothetical protein N7495_004342 [Penicillium taxi]|uniref:uncharacterized protein n=1 Tax=Penicillium taxi TaxID=168475 RepID=UPI002544FCD4|nr:uncharacterized protein N7495_004342 [Penicillium taxi]KAJ5899598.1 hypothetical protein N7495_004342 [Penicillium taxi]